MRLSESLVASIENVSDVPSGGVLLVGNSCSPVVLLVSVYLGE